MHLTEHCGEASSLGKHGFYVRVWPINLDTRFLLVLNGKTSNTWPAVYICEIVRIYYLDQSFVNFVCRDQTMPVFLDKSACTSTTMITPNIPEINYFIMHFFPAVF